MDGCVRAFGGMYCGVRKERLRGEIRRELIVVQVMNLCAFYLRRKGFGGSGYWLSYVCNLEIIQYTGN
jgi:hypothetical protein